MGVISDTLNNIEQRNTERSPISDALSRLHPEQGPDLNSSPYTRERLPMQSTLTAIARARNADSNETLKSLTALSRQQIEQGGDQAIREGLAFDRDVDLEQAGNKAAEELVQIGLGNERSAELRALIESQQQQLERSTAARLNDLERGALESIQNFGAEEDPAQRTIFLNNLEKDLGFAQDTTRDNIMKMVLYEREIDKLINEHEARGWHRTVFDWLGLVIPLNEITAALGIVPGERRGLFELPSTTVERAVRNLHNAPLNEFEEMLPEVFENIRDNSGFIGRNALLERQVAELYASVNKTNLQLLDVFSFVDAASIVPFSFLAKTGRNAAKLSRILGNRIDSTKVVTSAIQKAQRQSSEAARAAAAVVDEGIDDAMDPIQAVAESLPGTNIPHGMELGRVDIGAVGDVARRIDDSLAATQELDNVKTLSRLTEEQFEELAIPKQIDRLFTRFKDENIVDFVPKATLDDIAGPYKPLSTPELEALAKESDLGLDVSTIGQRVPGARNIGDDLDEQLIELSQAQRGAVPSRTGNGSMTQAEINKLWPEKALQDFTDKVRISEDSETQLRILSMWLGRKSGTGGYSSEAAAQAAGKRRGLLNFAVDQNVDGQYFIRLDEVVQETGIIKPAVKDIPLIGNRVSNFLRSIDNLLPEQFNGFRQLSGLAQSNINARIVRRASRPITKLTPLRREHLEAVLTVGEREGKWFDLPGLKAEYDRLIGRAPSDDEIAAYGAFKALNDMDYRIRNRGEYAKKARAGFETIAIPGLNMDPRNARLVTDLTDLRNMRILDVDDNIYKTPGMDLADTQRKLDTGDWHLFEIEEGIDWSGDPVKFVLVNKSSVQRGPLSRTQIPYRPGGHRIYDARWFVKQTARGEFTDGGRYLRNPHTHIAASTRGEAQEWAVEMERARTAYNDFKAGRLTEAQASAIIDETPVESLAKFDELVEDGRIVADEPFETLFDRQLPAAYDDADISVAQFVDEHMDGPSQWYTSSGRMYYSQKGEHLVSPSGELAPTLDPISTLGRALDNAAFTRAFNDYNTFAIEEWVRLARPYIDPQSVNLRHGNTKQIFYDAKIKDKLKSDNPRLFTTLESNRHILQRTLSEPTQQQRLRQQATIEWADFLEGGTVQSLVGKKIARKLSKASLDVMSADPISAMRGAVFDAYLGFFDVGQLLLQTQTAAAAATISPKYGMSAMSMYRVMRHATINTSEDLLDTYAKRFKSWHGQDIDDFKNMVRTFRHSGLNEVDGELVQLQYHTNGVGANRLTAAAGTARRTARFFFYEAERINRAVAWQIAWKETRDRMAAEGVKNVDTTSREFLSRVHQRTQDFSQNMTTQSAAEWQRNNITTLGTQFLSFQARMIENMLPAAFGGNKRFTGGQKARLAAGQMFFYGTGGIPLADWMFNFIDTQRRANGGEELDKATYDTLTTGFMDTMLRVLSDGELDTDFSDRAGIGSGFNDLYNRVARNEFSSSLEVALGPVGGFGGDIMESTRKLLLFYQTEQTGLLSQEAFDFYSNDIIQNISSLRRLTKAHWAWTTGTIKDSRTGRPAISGVTKLESIAAGLGIPLREETERWARFEEIENREDLINDYAQQVAKNRAKWFEAYRKNDEKEMRRWAAVNQGLVQVLRNDPLLQQQVLERATSIQNLPQDAYTRLLEEHRRVLGRNKRNSQMKGE